MIVTTVVVYRLADPRTFRAPLPAFPVIEVAAMFPLVLLELIAHLSSRLAPRLVLLAGSLGVCAMSIRYLEPPGPSGEYGGLVFFAVPALQTAAAVVVGLVVALTRGSVSSAPEE